MAGSKMTSMTPDEMRAAVARGDSRTDIERVRREAALGIEPAEDADSPDAAQAMRDAIAAKKVGRPKLESPRVMVSMRVEPDVVEAYKARATAEGKRYQTLMQEALRKVIAEA